MVLAIATLALARPAAAIPSPDVVMSVCASAGQVLGVLSLGLGGMLCARRRPMGAAKPRAGRPWLLGLLAGVLLLSVAANVLQYAHDVDARSARLARNLVRPSVENGERVGDVSLKTLSFSEQVKHPLGIRTEDLAARLGDPKLELVDVREPEEVETGAIAGSWHVRYPDLLADPGQVDHPDRDVVLLCYSGNRSSEICEELSKRGITTHFMIGGYEKWIAEGRPLDRERSADDLRALPAYPNQSRLLDTAEVEALVRDRDAVFVDVRYEDEFEQHHLPDAIDLPIRKMSTAAMEAAFATLPKDRPIIAPCYDKRSSFYAMVLGLRLYRHGLRFAGRYTLPFEYMVAGAERPHVARWHELQKAPVLAPVTRPFRATLDWLYGHLGSLALAIVALVVLLRLALVPVTWKQARDEAVQRRLAPEIAALRSRAGDDRVRASRSVLALQRRHHLTPTRNLIGSLLQLAVFLALFGAVAGASASAPAGFLWVPSLGAADPLWILPLSVGVLAVVQMRSSSARRGLLWELVRVAVGVGLVVLCAKLPAGVVLYLVCSFGLVLLQAVVVRAAIRGRTAESSPRQVTGSIVPLRHADGVADSGNKAARLAQLLRAGLPVPDGFVVRGAALAGDAAGCRREQRAIARLWRKQRLTRVAVRSSGTNEDGSERSYAGIFESVLDVDRDGLRAALQVVRDSMTSERARSYGDGATEYGSALVQQMVPAEWAGVLFTEDPMHGGAMRVEMVEGLGESLVSGNRTPQAFRLGRHSGRLLGADAPPLDLAPLLELARRIETLFGRPQDIEWAFADGEFWIVQARDITVATRRGSADPAALRREETRRVLRHLTGVHRELAPDEAVLSQNELCELLPRPTPLSLSVMSSLWEVGGSTDLACRSLGVPYAVDDTSAPMLVSAFGQLYVDQLEARRRVGKGPGVLASFRLARVTEALQTELADFERAHERDLRLREALDLHRLSSQELLDLFTEEHRRFVTETYVVAERVNVAASAALESAQRALDKRGLNAAAHLGGLPRNVVTDAMALLPEIRAGRRSEDDFLATFGHRAPLDWELACPRYHEDRDAVRRMVSRAAPPQPRSAAAREPLPSGMLAVLVERACSLQALKEDAKHLCLRDFAVLRRIALELGRELDDRDDVFWLTVDELPLLAEPHARESLQQRIAERRARAAATADVLLPAEITTADLEDLEQPRTQARASGALVGTLVAGSEAVVGQARVVHGPADLDAFEDGEILVARFTEPTWAPLFPRAGGMVTEVGGCLSHAAIVARECGLTAVVGVRDAVRTIQTGEWVRIELDGRVERLPRLERVAS